MNTDDSVTSERLIRVQTVRRGTPVELRVHYEIDRVNGCDTYRLFAIEEPK